MNKYALILDKLIVTFIVFFFGYYDILINFSSFTIINKIVFGSVIFITPYAIYLTYKARFFQIFFWLL